MARKKAKTPPISETKPLKLRITSIERMYGKGAIMKYGDAEVRL